MSIIREWLRGKKTYMLAVSAILGALVAYGTGEYELGKTVEIIVGALGIIFIRLGVTDSTAPR